MDPQVKMVLTSMGGALATAVATWAASKGLISASDQVNDANALVTVGSAVVGGLLVWYAHHQTSQKSMIAALPQAAMIQAVNADKNNGVKVVADDARSAPIAAVNEPVK